MDKWELLKKHIAAEEAKERTEAEKMHDPESEYAANTLRDILNKMAELEEGESQ